MIAKLISGRVRCPMTFFISSRVCIRDKREAFSVKARFPDHFRYLVLDVEDNEDQNVIRLFPEYASVALRSVHLLLTVWPEPMDLSPKH